MCYFMIYMVLACYVLLGVPRMFHLTQLLHFSDYLAFIVPFLLATIFFGMTISCVVRYRENIMLLVVFTSVPFLFLSGVTWRMADDRLAHSLHLRHTRLRPHERDGGNHPGHPGGV